MAMIKYIFLYVNSPCGISVYYDTQIVVLDMHTIGVLEKKLVLRYLNSSIN